jgi:excisionase family DNA binding protein
MAQDKAACSKAELAAQLGVSKDSVNRAIKRGEVKTLRFGRRVLIPQTEVSRLLQMAK